MFQTGLKNTHEREEFSVTCHYESVKTDPCLLSHTAKTKPSGKKNVLLLSTMRPLNSITRDDNQVYINFMTSQRVELTLWISSVTIIQSAFRAIDGA